MTRGSTVLGVLGWAGLLLGAWWSLAPGAIGESVFDMPYRNQLDGSPYAMANCGPTALSMVLAFYGIDASPWELRVASMQVQHSWVDDDGGYSNAYGVFVYNLASVAQTYGLRTTGLWTYEGSRVDQLRQWEPDDLRRELALDRPVIVEVEYRALPAHQGSRATADHYIVLHGFSGSEFLYSDPMGLAEDADAVTINEADLFYAMGQAMTPRVAFAAARKG